MLTAHVHRRTEPAGGKSAASMWSSVYTDPLPVTQKDRKDYSELLCIQVRTQEEKVVEHKRAL